MKNVLFEGCGTAISTPFTKDGVNFEEFGKLIEEQIKNEIDAIIVTPVDNPSNPSIKLIAFVIPTIHPIVKII